MNEEKALTIFRENGAMTLADTMTLGKVLAESGFFQDSRQASQAVVKVLAGRELGFGPIASMTGINVIQGRVAITANLMAAAVKRSGRYDYRVRKLEPDVCEIEFFEHSKPVGISTFTADDARKAQTKNMDKFPRNMLFARAMSNGVKWYCPDITNGTPIYTPEELGAIVDGETGEIISNGGPAWTAEATKAGEEPAHAPAPAKAEAPKAEPAKPATDEAKASPAGSKTSKWKAAAGAALPTMPHFANLHHMAAAARKIGFLEVTDDNLDAVLDALRTYASQKETEQQTEPLPGM